MSSGGTTGSATLLAGVQYAYDAGVVHISITHNDGIGSVSYPGRFAETIAVGATNQMDQRAGFSNYGPEIDLCADLRAAARSHSRRGRERPKAAKASRPLRLS